MKGIKILFGALAAAGLLISVSATAQENANRDADGKVVRGPYETNGLWDNTFLKGALGINTTIPDVLYFGGVGLATEISFGKWFTPAVGARVGWSGLNDDDARSGDIATYAGDTHPNHFGFNYLHVDAMWNMLSTFDGYKETRFYTPVPYFTVGVLGIGGFSANSKHPNLEYAAGFGLDNLFRINDRWDVSLDLRMLVEKEQAYHPHGRFYWLPTATVGAVYNFGKTGFDRHSSVTPVVIPVPFTLDEYNDLQKKVADLEEENAALKDKVAALEEENAKYHNYTEGQTYVYQNGEFVATDAKQGAPVALYFDLGKATLTEREQAHLEYFAMNVLNEDSKVLLTASADKGTGTASGNQKLSEKRADYVKNLLIKKYGLKEENIEINAVGETNNVFDTPAKNRVVTIEVK